MYTIVVESKVKMEKRKFKRFKTRQIAKIGGKLGVVNDISDTGIQISTAFTPKNRKIDISFELYGKMIEVMGIVQWVKWKKQIQTLNQMGIFIKEAPEEFLQYVSGLET
jgi:hypothetical protein